MIIKTARRGEKVGEKFWGCSNYPNCKYSENYTEEDIVELKKAKKEQTSSNKVLLIEID